MRILFVASEVLPFSKTGVLPDVVGALPKALGALCNGGAPGLSRVFMIHKWGYRGQVRREVRARAAIPETVFNPGALEFYGDVNLLKGGIVYSDYITTVSPRYAQEIKTPEFGYGLDGVVRGRGDRVVGILNGVDYAVWNPAKDTFIAAKYSAKDLAGKQACKQDLLQTFGLATDNPHRAVLGIVSRFADQKGFDLIADRAHEVLHEDGMLVVRGTGDRRYEDLFRALASAYPRRVGFKFAYDNAVAHKIKAGSHIFLMPSPYDPSRLNQIYSLKYGTVPVVRATGGLDDTVESFDVEHGTGNGFTFS